MNIIGHLVTMFPPDVILLNAVLNSALRGPTKPATEVPTAVTIEGQSFMEPESVTTHESDTPVGQSSKARPPRQSKRRKRSQARKIEEHGEALAIPDVSLDLIAHKSSSLTLRQLEQLVDQLGYVPYNLVDIGSMSDDEEPAPQVAVLYPMNKSLSSGRYAKESLPFPTMLWLSCPTLHTEICELEVEGWVDKLCRKLQSSDESATYLAVMENAHKMYATERWNMLTDTDRELIEEKGWSKSLKDCGVAGMRDFSGVKCLHCHYAHHLARPEHGNIIGVWVHELLLQKRAGISS